MKRLLALEYYKNLTYRPFKIFTSLYFIVLIALLFIGLINIQFSGGFEINLKTREFITSRKYGILQPGSLPF